jgi:hypothetical protein
MIGADTYFPVIILISTFNSILIEMGVVSCGKKMYQNICKCLR